MDESVVKHLEQPKVGTLKLSEAIRAGCHMVGELRTGWMADDCACALGTALYAVGERGLYASYLVFPALEQHFGITPCFAEKISHLHYREKKSREQIADWLESKGF